MSTKKGFTTRMVHHDRLKQFPSGPVHAPIYNSVPYTYNDTASLIDVFQNKASGHTYSRQSTPTTAALESLVTAAEQGMDSLVFASGMAALQAVFFALLRQGDHVIASRYLFGNTQSLLMTLQNFGVEVSQVDVTDLEHVKAAQQQNTRLVFVETIANPGTQIADLSGIGEWANAKQLIYLVDNTITSPYLFCPKTVGASLVMNSLSKYFSGHGTVLGGSITDTGLYDWSQYGNIFPAYRTGSAKGWGLRQLKKKALRDTGATLSSDSAYQLAVGAETMALRMDRACHNALALAKLLNQHPSIERIYYPGLEDHPQHSRAKSQFRHFGAILSFDLAAGIDCSPFLDSLTLVANATHVGDNRTLALPMASTIFHEMSADKRAFFGIGERMIRCSVGIEDENDLLEAFAQALERL